MSNPLQADFDALHQKILLTTFDVDLETSENIKPKLFELIRSYNGICRVLGYPIKHTSYVMPDRPEV